jgi:beta-fructofuranosidase
VAEDLEETQNVAVPEDTSDPYLRKWVKIPENPVLRHPERVYKEDFRDPSTAWQADDGSWRITVGAQIGTDGMALLYKSDDLVHWELETNVLRAIPRTGMWECLDFYPVASMGQTGLDTSVRGPSVKHVLKVSAFDTKRDYYAVGSYDVVTEAFTPINQQLDVIYALQYDQGKFYASKSFYDPVKQRRVNWGWSNESDTEAQDIAKGWASLLVSKLSV